MVYNLDGWHFKDCPKCGKKMIEREGTLRNHKILLADDGVQYPWHWYCGCGHLEEGDSRPGHSEQEWSLKRWEWAQEAATKGKPLIIEQDGRSLTGSD